MTTNPTTTPKPATSSTVDELKEILRMELDNVKAILAAEVSCLTHTPPTTTTSTTTTPVP